MDKVLVIGSSGLVGSRLMELGSGRYEMCGTYNTHDAKQKNTFRLDLANRDATFRLVERLKPDYVIDTHSLNNLDYCETHVEEAWRVNVEGTRNIAEACKNFACKYALISTDYVFDGKKRDYTEKDKPHPLNYYAKTKLVAEQILYALDINYIVVRPAVIYGKGGMNKMSFAVWLINELKAGKAVRVVTDQHENPTFADALTEHLFALYENDETGVFHATGKDCVSRMDFSREIVRLFGLNEKLLVPVTTPELSQIAQRPARVNMVTEKLERATKINTLTIKEGLARLKEQLGA